MLIPGVYEGKPKVVPSGLNEQCGNFNRHKSPRVWNLRALRRPFLLHQSLKPTRTRVPLKDRAVRIMHDIALEHP